MKSVFGMMSVLKQRSVRICKLPDPSGETNLVAYYKLNETSGTAADNSEGNSDLDGTLNNMTGNEWQTSPAMFGPKNALDFDGTDDYVDLGSGLLSTSNASQAFTIVGLKLPTQVQVQKL